MSFFLVGPDERLPKIEGDKVYLRGPQAHDYEEWTELRRISASFLKPWEPSWPADDLMRGAFRRRLKRYYTDARDDLAYAFFLFRRDDDRLLGGATLSNVRRGVTQSCSLGYWMGQPYAGHGYMAEGTRLICDFAFRTLDLHRVEAATLLHNDRSRHLLEKAGFVREGLARSYLLIDGRWQDHFLYALLANDAIPPALSPFTGQSTEL